MPLRSTPQRRLIRQVLGEAPGPMSIQEIHETAGEELGVATVYRNVKRLHEAGEVEAHVFPDGSTRYETAGDHHHHHFLCDACGRSFCFDSCPVHVGDVAMPAGFTVGRHELILHGTCPDCGAA